MFSVAQRLVAVAAVLISAAGLAAAADDLCSWPPVTAEARPWIWWWWHGSAVDQTNLVRELTAFREAGLGGVQITTIYGTKGAEAQEIPYLSPAWLDMMGYTVAEAKRLGLGVDMSLGSGWCFGGPTVSDRDADAKVIVKKFRLGAGQSITNALSIASVQAVMAFSTGGGCQDLTRNLGDDGRLRWRAPAGDWAVYVLSEKPSGQRVKRAARGGEGWMLNPLFPQAMQDWLRWFDGSFADYHGPMPAAVFQDSYEYHTDWSPNFLAQFERRRGYRLQTELPALLGTNRDLRTARVKYDYRRTVADILADESEPTWIRWAHRKGFATIYQAHGTPGNWLDLYGEADVPETEMFHRDRSILISKFASSAAHTQGHPLTGAETGTWLEEHFTETLGDLKNLADDMFLAGVNRIFYHGACYSPADASWPGWLFYASTEMNPRNSIWRDVGALNAYIARCQSMLQSGRPDNDILLYWPVADFWSDSAGLIQSMGVSEKEWFEAQPVGETAKELWQHGYGFDYVSDSQLLKARMDQGRIRLPGGEYAAVVIPRCHYMPWATIERLTALANAGATVCFVDQMPDELPGLHREKLQKSYTVLRQHFASGSLPLPGIVDSHRVGRGWFIFGSPLAALPLAQVPCETMVDGGLAFERRANGRGWSYFIVNRSGANFDDWISLARPARAAAILDPLSGNSGVAETRESVASHWLRIHLQLGPGQSTLVRATPGAHVGERPWAYFRIASNVDETQNLGGEWKVSFVTGGPELPPDFQVHRLQSWTAFPVAGAEAFAGTACYSTKFDVPDPAGKTFSLDLGDVRQSARVRINGEDYGILISPPFRVLVNHLKPTGNVLEVEVTSVAANRIRDLDRRGVKWKIFKDINFVNVDYQPFDATNWPLTACGLLGPVTLTAAVPE